MWFAHISSHFVDYLFTFFMMSFEAQKFLVFIKSYLSIFFLQLLEFFDVTAKKPLHI